MDFLKVDTQGTELAILNGASQALADTVFGIELEVEFESLYEHQPLFSDIDSYIRARGFSLFDMQPQYWKRRVGYRYGKPKGQLVFADALFLRSLDSFRAIWSGMEREEARSKVIRALSVCLLYGYHDYAEELLQDARSALDAADLAPIQSMIQKRMGLGQMLPRFRGRHRLAELFYRLYEIFRVREDWSDSGRPLGNL